MILVFYNTQDEVLRIKLTPREAESLKEGFQWQKEIPYYAFCDGEVCLEEEE